MSNYVISSCSTADLTKEHFEKRNISYICFHYELNGKEYADDLGQSMPFDVFYKAMQDGASTKTSQVNADEFEEYFEGFLKQGKDVLHVCLSSGRFPAPAGKWIRPDRRDRWQSYSKDRQGYR